ncbi:MAG: acetate kinase [Bacilli bacterium]
MMKILSVNAGSSSLKFTLFEMPEESVVVSGTFEKIGASDSFYVIKFNGEKLRREVSVPDHEEAIKCLLKELIDNKIILSYDEIEGVGHRVVNGGSDIKCSKVINDNIISKIEEMIPIAPLHNPANLKGIRSFMEVMPKAHEVAVFDTSFHTTMEETEFMYPIPYNWYTDYGVRKYGAHGTSHQYITEYMRSYLGRDTKLISCHIGSGASICLVNNGKCVDTSIGFTPLGGIMMGTRCGDIDPGFIPYIMDKTTLSVDAIFNILNKQSGLDAISGVGPDLRDIEKGYNNGDTRCALAINMYVKRIVNFISDYIVELGGVDNIVFTAGVGERSPLIRQLVCDKLGIFGVLIDPNKNKEAFGEFGEISAVTSKIQVFVVPTDEEVMIARDTYNSIK